MAGRPRNFSMYHAAKLKLGYSSHISNLRPRVKMRIAGWPACQRGWHAGFACFIVVLLGVYLFFAQSIATDRFLLESIESRIAKLRGENAALEVASLEEQSLSNLKIESMEFQLEEVKNISYIQPKSEAPLVLRN